MRTIRLDSYAHLYCARLHKRRLATEIHKPLPRHFLRPKDPEAPDYRGTPPPFSNYRTNVPLYVAFYIGWLERHPSRK